MRYAEEETVRYSIDLPTGLHLRMKIECAKRGKKMAEVLQEIFEREFPT